MSHPSFFKSRYWAVIPLALILTLTLALPALAQEPVLQDTDPDENEVAAPVDTDISAMFGDPLDTSTVDSDSFVAHGMYGGVLAGTYSFPAIDADRTVTFNPTRNLFPGESVFISLTDDIEGAGGGGGDSIAPYVWQFTAAAGTGGTFNETSVKVDKTWNARSVAWGDYDGDGDLDLAVCYGNQYHAVWVFPNNGNGTFGESIDVDPDESHSHYPYSVAWGDFDNDGDLDLAVGSDTNNYSAIYPNNGNGTFGSPLHLPGGNATMSIALGDFNHDGYLDLAAGRRIGQNEIYPNNGNGTFGSAVKVGPSNDRTRSVAWGDIDGDGNLDLAVGNESGGQSVIYRNNGNGTMDDSNPVNVGSTTDNTYSVAFGDYDNDGDLDLAMGNDNGQNVVYPNNGVGVFGSGVNVGPENDRTKSLAWGDFNGDGNLDLAVGNESQQNMVYPSNGDGSFGVPVEVGLGTASSQSLDWGDFDGDGDLDLAVGNESQKDEVYLNEPPPPPPYLTARSPITNTVAAPLTSTVTLTYSAEISAATVTSQTVAIHSMMQGLITETHTTADNVVTVNPTRDFFPGELVYAIATTQTTDITGTNALATGWQFTAGEIIPDRCVEGFTQEATASFTTLYSGDAAWGDYDNDGDLDILLAGQDSNDYTLTEVWRNDGGGGFSQVSTAPTGVMDGSVAWGDYDNDGDLDILLTGTFVDVDDDDSWSVTEVWRNDGGDIFTDIGAGLTDLGEYSSAAWGDYDNDGNLDILLIGYDGSDPLAEMWRNNGDGTFTENTSAGLPGRVEGNAAWGDYDNDGDLDILLVGYDDNDDPLTEVWRNDGGGNFNLETNHPTDIYGTAAWGDYDNDGNLDILLAGGGTSTRVTEVWHNDGGGNFSLETGANLTQAGSGDAIWGDYDNDGDLDILLTGRDDSNTSLTEVWRNDSSGSFSKDDNADLTPLNNSSAAWGDYDNDGDLDLFLTGRDSSGTIIPPELWRNDDCSPDVSISKTATPAFAKPGEAITYTLTFSNAGAGLATGVIITDSVPVSVTNPAIADNSGAVITPTGSAPNFAWDVEDLSTNEGGIITLTGVLSYPLGAGIFTNTAVITTTDTESDVTNNSSAAAVAHCGNTITVQNINDSGAGSLRQAIADVCPGGVIDFNLTYPATILTNDDDYSFDKPLNIKGPGPENLTIRGPGDSCSSCESIFYVYDLDATDVVTLSGMTIRDGYYDDGGGIYMYDSYATLIVSNTHILENTAYDGDGGGIFVDDDGTLIVYSSVISGNYADSDGGGIASLGTLTVTNSLIDNNECDGDSGGGGIYIEGSTAFITGTTVSNNRSTYDDGGGICTYYDDEVVTIVNSAITGNYAEDDGGGLKLDGCTATITNTLISDNEAYYDGGGMHIDYGSDVTIFDSTLSGNLADEYGGGIHNEDGGDIAISGTDFITNTANSEDGGGIYNESSDSFAISNSTFISNTADSVGGGIYSEDTMTITASLFIGNTAGDDGAAIGNEDELDITNSLLVNNGVFGGGSVINLDGSSATLTISHTTIASATLGIGSAIEVTEGTLNAVNNIIANYTTGIINSDTVNEDYNLFAGNSTNRVGVTPGAHSWSSSKFSGAGFVDAAGGNFHLSSSSWALNKGTNAGITTDFDGDARPGGGGYDLGYDETTYTGPTANDDPDESTVQNISLTISPLTNDTKTDGDALHIGAVGSPPHGTATISGTTQIVYTPTTGYNGTDVFTYTAREDSRLADTASITVTVTPNTAPVATAGGNQSVAQGSSVQLDGSGSSDVNGDTLTYGWRQTGGSPPVTLSSSSAISPTFTAPGSETVLTFTLTITDTGGLTDTSTVVVTVEKVSDIYLPLIFKGFAIAPDLVVESFVPTSSGITIVIKNEGNMPITENFWVDVYFDPSEIPTLNHEWETIAPAGAVWGVTDNIPAGNTLTLTVGDKYYYANESSNPPFPVGVPAYTYIDSINYDTDYGNILELDETDNLFGPVTSTAGAETILPLSGEAPSAAGMPGRYFYPWLY